MDAYDARMVALARDRALVQVRTGNEWTRGVLIGWRTDTPRRGGRYARVNLRGRTLTVRQADILHPDQEPT